MVVEKYTGQKKSGSVHSKVAKAIGKMKSLDLELGT